MAIACSSGDLADAQSFIEQIPMVAPPGPASTQPISFDLRD